VRQLLTILLLALSTLAFASFEGPDARFLMVPVQFVVVNGNYDASVVYLRKAGETVGSFKGQKSMRLKMEFDSEYQLDFTKPGYITKSVKVSTLVPPERKKLGFESYKIGVRLFKQYDGVNIVVYNQAVASIRYLPELDEFSYDTDYTKSILSLLTATEEILEQKARDEVEAGRKTPVGKTNTLEKSDGKAQFQAPESVDYAPMMPLITLPLPRFLYPVMAAPMKTLDGRWPMETVEDTAHVATGYGGEDPTAETGLNEGEDLPPTGNAEGGEESHVGVQPVSSGLDVEVELSVLPKGHSIEVSRIREKRRTITVLHIHEGGKTREYKRIEYDWGETYYFMDRSLTISEHLFNYLIRQKQMD